MMLVQQDYNDLLAVVMANPLAILLCRRQLAGLAIYPADW